jgi:hypothetical protein
MLKQLDTNQRLNQLRMLKQLDTNQTGSYSTPLRPCDLLHLDKQKWEGALSQQNCSLRYVHPCVQIDRLHQNHSAFHETITLALEKNPKNA